jgi:hypothetical protein
MSGPCNRDTYILEPRFITPCVKVSCTFKQSIIDIFSSYVIFLVMNLPLNQNAIKYLSKRVRVCFALHSIMILSAFLVAVCRKGHKER